jgi:hypothetical protein
MHPYRGLGFMSQLSYKGAIFGRLLTRRVIIKTANFSLKCSYHIAIVLFCSRNAGNVSIALHSVHCVVISYGALKKTQ